MANGLQYLPSYSAVSSSHWSEEAAQGVYLTSEHFDDIIHIDKLVSFPDPTTAAALLSRRQKDWLDAFLKSSVEMKLSKSLVATFYYPQPRQSWLLSDGDRFQLLQDGTGTGSFQL